MPGLVEVVSNYIRPYYYYIIVITFALIFAALSYYAYINYYKKTVDNKFANVANANRRNKEVDILFFHVDWCPHCVNAKPEWNRFKQQYNDKELNGYIIKCRDVDCTTETSEVTSIMSKYGIESYPTIKMMKDTKIIDFDSKIKSRSLEQFVTAMVSE
jgi:thiol-disulfide isomerase/thioredoxin